MLSIEPNSRVTFGVAYEDEHLLVLEKPGRLVSTPGVGHEHDTLLNGVFASHGDRLQQLGRARDFGMLQRLDRDTSGLILVALTTTAYEVMRRAFVSRDVAKYYWAVCLKAPRDADGVIRRPIREAVTKGKYTGTKKAVLDPSGKPALTAFRTLEESPLGALLEARPVTGRFHQVRVHLASVGAAILGDRVYGPTAVRDASHRVALHAHRLKFTHPVDGIEMDLRSRFPKDLSPLLRRVSLHRPDLPVSKGGLIPDDAHEV